MEVDIATRGALKLVLLPPGILLVLMLAGWMLGRRLIGRLTLLVAIAGFYVLSTPAGVDWLAQRVETVTAVAPPQVATIDADAIWVLLAGIRDDNPEHGGAPWPGAYSMPRLDYALRLHRQTGLPIALSGGSPKGDTPPVAEVAAQWLRQQAAVEPLLVESASRDTWENARESARQFNARGIERVLLVTHAFHMPRAMLSARSAAVAVTPAPCCFMHTPADPAKPSAIDDYLPSPGKLGQSYLILHEMAGLVWYGYRHGAG